MGKIVRTGICIGTVLMLVILLFQIDIVKTTYSQEGVSTMNLGEIVLDKAVIQEIIVPVDTRVDQISIKLATFGRENTNSNNVELFVNNEKVYTRQLASETIIDDVYNQLFDEDLNLKLVAGDKVTIVLSSEDGCTGNAITVWGYDSNEKGVLYTRDQKGNLTKVEGTMNLQFTYDNTVIGDLINKYQNYPHILIFVVFMIIAGVTMLVKLCMNMVVEVFFNKE